MKRKVSLTLLVILFAIIVVTPAVKGKPGNQKVEITQVLSGEHMYYIVKVTDPDGIDVVHGQIRDPDGNLLWDSGFFYPDGATSLEFTIPEEAVIEYQASHDRLKVITTTRDEGKNTISQWETPEWWDWEPPYWPKYETLTCEWEHSYGVGGFVVPVDKFGLLAPYIGLASTILVATAATAVYVKRVKRRKEKQ